MDEISATGQCLCGAVRYRATVSANANACYCKMCQRWSAGVFMGVGTSAFEVTAGADQLKTFKSSDWAERGFCGTCGSNIFYRATDHSPSVAMGTLDDTGALQMVREYYVDQRPADLKLANDTHAMTEAETLRFFGVAEGGASQ